MAGKQDFSHVTDAELDQMVAEKLAFRIPRDSAGDFSNVSDDELDRMVAEKIQGGQDRPLEAALSGFGQGASLGYLPQLQAGAEMVLNKILPDRTNDALREQGFQVDDYDPSYVESRDSFINRDRALQEENPKAHFAGQIGGAISSAGAVSGAGVAGAATKTGRLVQAAKSGAAVGALRNPGDTEGELSPLQLKERATNAAWDAITGVVLQGGLEGLGKAGEVAKGAGKNLKAWSQNKALKAAGADKPSFKKAILNKKNFELGQSAIDNNLIKAGDSAVDIARNTENAIMESNRRLNSIYKQADDNPAFRLTKEDVRGIHDEYVSEVAERLSGRADEVELAEKLGDVLDTLPRNAGYKELRKWRGSLDDKITYSKANNDLEMFQGELLRLRSKVQEKIAEKIGKSNPALKREFQKENRNLSNLFEIKKIADQKSAALAGNTEFGMREGFGGMIGTGIGASVGGPFGAAAGAAIGAVTTNFARKHATPMIAIAANRAARALENRKELLGKFADPLIKSARSPEEFVMAVNAMMKDPEFKKQIDKININNLHGTGRDLAGAKKGNQ